MALRQVAFFQVASNAGFTEVFQELGATSSQLKKAGLTVAAERRRYTRLTTDHNVQCEISGMDVVHVVGLGSGGSGMRIITNHELPDDEFEVSLDLSDGKPILKLRGKAVWQEAWDFEIFNRHAAGIALSGLTPEEGARIDALIKNNPTDSAPPPDLP